MLSKKKKKTELRVSDAPEPKTDKEIKSEALAKAEAELKAFRNTHTEVKPDANGTPHQVRLRSKEKALERAVEKAKNSIEDDAKVIENEKIDKKYKERLEKKLKEKE